MLHPVVVVCVHRVVLSLSLSLSLSLKIQRKAGEDFTFFGEAGECEREANP